MVEQCDPHFSHTIFQKHSPQKYIQARAPNPPSTIGIIRIIYHNSISRHGPSLVGLIGLAADIDRTVVVLEAAGDGPGGGQQLGHGDDAAHPGATELTAELVGRVERIGEGDDEAGQEAGVHGQRVLGDVGQQEADTVARAQARAAEEGPGRLEGGRLGSAECVGPAGDAAGLWMMVFFFSFELGV